MQIFATALLAATAVSAAAIGKRDVVFNVSDFSAACM